MADVMLAHLDSAAPESRHDAEWWGLSAHDRGRNSRARVRKPWRPGAGICDRSPSTLTLDLTPGYCDMRSMHFGYAGAERLPLLAARVQLVSDYYGCPSGIHGGKTDSCVPGVQMGIEKALSMYAAVMAGAIGFGTVVSLKTASPTHPSSS